MKLKLRSFDTEHCIEKGTGAVGHIICILLKVKQAVLNHGPSAEVILFGSRARKDFEDFSDWDFLVLVDGDVDTHREDRIRHSLYEIEWDTGQVISTIVKSRHVWNNPAYRGVSLHKSVEREGIYL